MQSSFQIDIVSVYSLKESHLIVNRKNDMVSILFIKSRYPYLIAQMGTGFFPKYNINL